MYFVFHYNLSEFEQVYHAENGQTLCEQGPIVMDMNSLINNSLLANQIN